MNQWHAKFLITQEQLGAALREIDQWMIYGENLYKETEQLREENKRLSIVAESYRVALENLKEENGLD